MTKRIAGLSLRSFSVMIGKSKIIKEAEIQFVAVEKGTILG